MKRLHTILQISYGVLLLVGAVLYFVRLGEAGMMVAKYSFAAGAALAIFQTLLYAYQNRTDDIREARRQRLMFIMAVFLGVGAWYMWMENMLWVGLMTVYAVGSFYLSFRGGKKDD